MPVCIEQFSQVFYLCLQLFSSVCVCYKQAMTYMFYNLHIRLYVTSLAYSIFYVGEWLVLY